MAVAWPGVGVPRHHRTSPRRHGRLHHPPSNLFFCPAASWSQMAPAGLLPVCGLLCAWVAAVAGHPCSLHSQVGDGGPGVGSGWPCPCWLLEHAGAGGDLPGLPCCWLRGLLSCSTTAAPEQRQAGTPEGLPDKIWSVRGVCNLPGAPRSLLPCVVTQGLAEAAAWQIGSSRSGTLVPSSPKPALRKLSTVPVWCHRGSALAPSSPCQSGFVSACLCLWQAGMEGAGRRSGRMGGWKERWP